MIREVNALKTEKLFDICFSEENLRQLFQEKISFSKSIGLDKITTREFERNLDTEIAIIKRKINNCSYHFTDYRQMLISKGAQKYPREISIATVRDRLVLTALNRFMVSKLGTEICQTQLPQIVIQNIIDTIATERFNYYLKFDIEHFYSSLDHTLLMRKVQRKLRIRKAVSLLIKAIETPTKCTEKVGRGREKRTVGTPEGIPVSNTLANIYLQDVDRYWKKQENVCYYRYVDDILILCNQQDADQIKQLISKQIRRLRLSFNSKTESGSLKHIFTYLGYKFCGSKVSVRDSSVLHLEKNLENVLSRGRKDKNGSLTPLQLWKLNLRITGFIASKNRYGWLFYFSQLNDMQLLSHLDWLVQRLFVRYGYKNANQAKKYRRAYYEMRYNLHETRYIPNFDNYTLAQKRDLLIQLGIKCQEDAIEMTFHELVVKAASELEKDVQSFS